MIVVGATNRPELLDAALMRPGRFDKIIYVPPPDEISRVEILKSATGKTPLQSDVNLAQISKSTEGFSGADLDALCKEATLNAMNEMGLDQVQNVGQKHFDLVLRDFRPSLDRETIEKYQALSISN